MCNVSTNKTTKNMRLENELIELIELNGEGNNFTAKAEYCLRDYFYSVKEREDKILKLEKEIKAKEEKKESIEIHINKLSNLLETVGSILNNSFSFDNSSRWKMNKLKDNVEELENNLIKISNFR